MQYIGKYATYDAPCLALVALAAAIAITKRSLASASIVGTLLALATVTKYAGLALVPFVLAMTFLTIPTAEGRPWRRISCKLAYVEPLPRSSSSGSWLVVITYGGPGSLMGLSSPRPDDRLSIRRRHQT